MKQASNFHLHGSCFEHSYRVSCRAPYCLSGLCVFSEVCAVYVLQILFRKKLSSKQWLSLILLTAGCMIKQIDPNVTGSAKSSSATATPKSDSGFHLSINLVFIFVQVRFIMYFE
jgi:hypothetical protein